ncbi:hypothetical protein DL96DRAFT_1600767 [Flagelloscypha sp. PMI_526]|nr:hypothetical protein DL96DRAFT_1600767 [Flagelloscypha sp. PMI_526]
MSATTGTSLNHTLIDSFAQRPISRMSHTSSQALAPSTAGHRPHGAPSMKVHAVTSTLGTLLPHPSGQRIDSSNSSSRNPFPPRSSSRQPFANEKGTRSDLTQIPSSPPLPPIPAFETSVTEHQHRILPTVSTSYSARDKWNSVSRPAIQHLSHRNLPDRPPTPPAKSPRWKPSHSSKHSHDKVSLLPQPNNSIPGGGIYHYVKARPQGLANSPVLPLHPIHSRALNTQETSPPSSPSSGETYTSMTLQRDRTNSRTGSLSRRASVLSFSIPSVPTTDVSKLPDSRSLMAKLRGRRSDKSLRASSYISQPKEFGFDLASTPSTRAPIVDRKLKAPPSPSTISSRSSSETLTSGLNESLSYIYFDAEDTEPHVFRILDSPTERNGKRRVFKKKSKAPNEPLSPERPFQTCYIPTQSRDPREQSWVGEWNRQDISEVIHALRELR